MLFLLLFCRFVYDMNDKQDRPYVCGAPGCSQVGWMCYTCTGKGYEELYLLWKYIALVFVFWQKYKDQSDYIHIFTATRMYKLQMIQ